VSDVEDHPALLGRAGRREQLAVLHDVVAGAAERVREDISGTEEIEQIRQRARRGSDVTHDRHAFARHLGRADRAS
jgi:hypothetical protein